MRCGFARSLLFEVETGRILLPLDGRYERVACKAAPRGDAYSSGWFVRPSAGLVYDF